MPAIRALVQLRDVAADLGMLRAPPARREPRRSRGSRSRTSRASVNLPCYAQIRSAGMLLVQADNEGRTLFEIGPRERITQDFVDPRGPAARRRAGREPARASLRLFGRPVSARA